MVGTPGAAFVPTIQNLVREKYIQAVVTKGRNAAAYSAFDGFDPRGPKLRDVLKENRIDHIGARGTATAYPVRARPVDPPPNPFQVRVLANRGSAAEPRSRSQALARTTP